MASPSEARQREIRVFISSTFRDMQEEREELVKRVFPQLRQLCESRGVTWGEVDLRWGITDEGKAEGKVLPLCLAEIERCRPYFIGLLGERYGWVPEQIPEELLEAQPWLNEHRKRSVTALEILHGVLLNPKMAEHAFFYFRDPRYAVTRPGFTEDDEERRRRLAALKDDIRKSGLPVVENFATPKQLGEGVLRDLTALIDRLYPESEIPDPLDRAAADHEAYAASRRRVYVGRPEYMERLDAHVAGDGPPLVVLGESGGGKSALLANWIYRWRERHPERPVVAHFVGASPDSAEWMAMLRRLLEEFRRRFGIQIETPDKSDALCMAFANALHMVAARGRVVLVLDALNQLEDRDGGPDLVWLPPVIPANVRLVVSTLPGRPLEDLKRRQWPVMRVEPLEPTEREKLIDGYLGQYAKQLSPARRSRIAAASQAANGLYLTTLLNELRLFGRHEELDRRIGWYLEAAGPLELYRKVIARWEQDYRQPDCTCENVVRESLVRLWAARRGLSEAELLESLGTEGSPLPRAVWSPLFLAAGDALVNRGGLLTFAHDFLREAVREAYLPNPDHQERAHCTLASYFSSQTQGPRRLDELPWQWREAAEWQRLADLLVQPDFFAALWKKHESEVKIYWTQIEAHSPIRMEQVYTTVATDVSLDPDYSWRVGTLFADTGKPDAAFGVRARLVEHYRRTGDRSSLLGALGNLAEIPYVRGDLDRAMALFKETEHLCRELESKEGLGRTLGNEALILRDRGDLGGAMALLEEAERIFRELGNKEGLQKSLGSLAGILFTCGDLDASMVLLREAEHLCRELGNEEGLGRTLGNEALILRHRGELDGAMALLRETERICRELGNKHDLSTLLSNQAMIRKARGDLNGAIALLKEAERIDRELGDRDALGRTLGNEALILQDRRELEGAMVLLKEAERLFRELGDKDGLQSSLGNQANILYAREDLAGAMSLYREEERLCRELGRKERLSKSLAGQANILYARGDLDGALSLLTEQECFCREAGDKKELQGSLSKQAFIHWAKGDLASAMALYKEEERLCCELGNPYLLSIALSNQAQVLSGQPGRRAEARQAIEEAIEIAGLHQHIQLLPGFQQILDSLG